MIEYKCDYCGVVYWLQSDLLQHMGTVHYASLFKEDPPGEAVAEKQAAEKAELEEMLEAYRRQVETEFANEVLAGLAGLADTVGAKLQAADVAASPRAGSLDTQLQTLRMAYALVLKFRDQRDIVNL